MLHNSDHLSITAGCQTGCDRLSHVKNYINQGGATVSNSAHKEFKCTNEVWLCFFMIMLGVAQAQINDEYYYT